VGGHQKGSGFRSIFIYFWGDRKGKKRFLARSFFFYPPEKVSEGGAVKSEAGEGTKPTQKTYFYFLGAHRQLLTELGVTRPGGKDPLAPGPDRQGRGGAQ
jgi:hypothetical protein